MKKTILLFVFSLPILTYSQIFQREAATKGSDPFQAGVFSNNLDIFAVQKKDRVHNGAYIDNVEGNQYLYKKWNKCHITSKENKSLYLPCNYNLHNDQFEMRVGKDLYFLKDENINSVTTNNLKFRPLNKSLSMNDDFGIYYQLLSEGSELALIKRFKLKLETKHSTQSLGTFDQEIIVKEKLFFRYSDGKLVAVPNTKNKIIKTLNLDAELKKKCKHLNLRNTEALKKLIAQL